MSAIWAGALLVVYLGITGVVLLIGWSRVQPGGVVAHFAVLGAIAAATWTKHVPRWLRLWAPLLTLLFLYSEVPMLLRAIGYDALFDDTAIRWEGLLFDGQPALEWAERWPSRLASELLHGAYLSYYAIIFGVPVMLYFTGRQRDFSEAVFVLMLTFVACFLSYLVFPVAGPRYLWPSPANANAGPIRAATVWLLDARSSQGTAFPSSHVAVAVTQSILAVRYFGVRGLIVGVLTVGLAVGAVYGGFHYAIDALAGVLVGALVTIMGLVVARQLRRRASNQANANAPT